MVDIYNGILLNHEKNTFKSVLKKRMNLETIIQSEVSQKGKYKYLLTFTDIYGI